MRPKAECLRVRLLAWVPVVRRLGEAVAAALAELAVQVRAGLLPNHLEVGAVELPPLGMAEEAK